MDQVIYKEATRTMFSSFLAKRRERKKGPAHLFGGTRGWGCFARDRGRWRTEGMHGF